jgi:UDP-glucose 4-epimerase
MFKDKTFLVTGGTGSFGNTLINYLLKTDVKKIKCFSRDENKQNAMQIKTSDSRIDFILGDVRDLDSVTQVLNGVDYIFHAAALKHVPISESAPWEFIQTNIHGSRNLLLAMKNSTVQKAVFLSTDKAVYPLNTMGMTKAIMEKMVRSNNFSSSSNAMITRYGNVIGSRGSVIPYFIQALQNGEIANITNPYMTRFMMTLDESVNLVLYALKNGNPGELFVQKSPAATVETIFFAVASLLNISNPKFNICGIRPGEKIHETLLTAEEMASAKSKENYFAVPSLPNFNFDPSALHKTPSEYSSNSTTILNQEQLVNMLRNNPQIQNILNNKIV